MTKKQKAQRLAQELTKIRSEALGNTFATYMLNPSATMYEHLMLEAKRFQQARNTEYEIAEWDGE